MRDTSNEVSKFLKNEAVKNKALYRLLLFVLFDWCTATKWSNVLLAQILWGIPICCPSLLSWQTSGVNDPLPSTWYSSWYFFLRYINAPQVAWMCFDHFSLQTLPVGFETESKMPYQKASSYQPQINSL